ncbi:MAG: hypothetical protein IT168_19060 [Bryobacterales bacterium]|nr:hypothetical protein [Bryobacterales bacterium]
MVPVAPFVCFNGRMSDPARLGTPPRVISREEKLERLRSSLQALETKEENLRLFTRSIAHDFNNILGGILGHASLIQGAAEAGTEIADSAQIIQKAAERAKELITELLDSTRREHPSLSEVDLHEMIREVANLVRGTTPPSVYITLKLDAVASRTVGDPGQLHHMLLNLALNARDAMPDGGELTFETRSSAEPTPTIRIAVQDSGCGIAEDVRPRIFEPSFTTKTSGGSGMGLAIVQRVVHYHGGKVELESAAGHGSRFLITLPLHQVTNAASAAAV